MLANEYAGLDIKQAVICGTGENNYQILTSIDYQILEKSLKIN